MHNPEPLPPMALRIKDAAKAVGICRASLYKLHRDGKIRIVKIAGRSVVPRADLERLFAA